MEQFDIIGIAFIILALLSVAAGVVLFIRYIIAFRDDKATVNTHSRYEDYESMFYDP